MQPCPFCFWTWSPRSCISDAAYLYLQNPGSGGGAPGETVSVYDELGINLDSDRQGRLTFTSPRSP